MYIESRKPAGYQLTGPTNSQNCIRRQNQVFPAHNSFRAIESNVMRVGSTEPQPGGHKRETCESRPNEGNRRDGVGITRL